MSLKILKSIRVLGKVTSTGIDAILQDDNLWEVRKFCRSLFLKNCTLIFILFSLAFVIALEVKLRPSVEHMSKVDCSVSYV